jgi:NAD(P)-dependent dehydrogenase (short-subunit alcohol dehydrogenase family)
MKDFAGKLAVITGAGTGMGRELARLLAHDGCHVALCDVQLDKLDETRALCADGAPSGTRVTVSQCDVADERSVEAFRDDVKQKHATEHINLLFNNAGIGGGGSFLRDSRKDWDRTFAVCWNGVYFCTRAFMPLLVASDEGHLVNTSSVNGFWACLGAGQAHTAYSSAKFAVKGFSEALVVDLRLNAPHVKVSLVMPGHIGTSIFENSQRLLHDRPIAEMNAQDLAPFRASLERQGIAADAIPDEALRAGMQQFADAFRDHAPTTAAAAAQMILDGVRAERWRILLGEDAQLLDTSVRNAPERAYDKDFTAELAQRGLFGGLGVRR